MNHPIGRAVAAAALGATLAASPAARADIDPATTIKPLVMILLDTSGSMEYEVGDSAAEGEEYTVPLCEEPDATSPSLFAMGAFPKSRLVVAKEVLTGTIQDYWCQYDYRDSNPLTEDFNYPIPQVRACSGDTGTGCGAPVQEFDGITDIYRDDAKFVLVTFDSHENPSDAWPGMFSYGPSAPGINLGVRNGTWGIPDKANEWDADAGTWSYADPDRLQNNRGQLVLPPAADDFGSVRSQNRDLQYEVLSTIGYWGTPLAPMLDDVRWLLMNEEGVGAYDAQAATGDPYYSCRKRIAILVTDGRASQGEGVGGYPTTAEAIESLKDTPPTAVEVYVVGFNLKGDDASLLDELDPENGGPATDVFVADTAAELSNAIASVLSVAQSEIRSRTQVTYTNATRSTTDLQYQINASFQTDPDSPTNLVGYLDQTIFQCSEECEGTSTSGQSCARDVLHLDELVSERSNDTRTMLAIVDGEIHPLDDSLVDLAPTVTDMAEKFSVPQSGDLPVVNPDHFDGTKPVASNDVIGPASSYDNQAEYLRQLVALVRADDGTMRQGKHLGGITHATPVVQEAVREGTHPIRSWNVYANTALVADYPAKCRPTVLYTGTHDGKIHAFRIDHLVAPTAACAGVPTQDDADVGKELWSIVPHHALERTHSLVGKYNYLLDGQPVVRDVLLQRGNPKNADPNAEATQWRSMLVTGYGAGGRGFVALDVTDALDGPKLLWEIDDERHCAEASCTDAALDAEKDFSLLGLTSARPAFGTRFEDGLEEAIVILPGGDTPDDTGSPQAGRVVYVVSAKTGVRVAAFSEAEGNVEDQDGNTVSLDFAFTGSPAAYSEIPGVVTTRTFLGDAGGRLWRIDMADADPSEWKMVLFYDPYADGEPLEAEDPSERQPVFGAPALAIRDAQGHLAVVYGTGDIDYVAKSVDSKAGVFSISEATDENGVVVPEVNWVKELAAEERLTGEPLIFNKAAYFTTYTAQEADACLGGTGKLFGVHFTDTDTGDSGGAPLAQLDEDGSVATIDLVSSIDLGDAVPYGVTVIERPACRAGAGGAQDAQAKKADAGATTKGDLELVVNVAQGPANDAKLVPPGVDAATARTKNVVRDLATSGEMFQSAAWGLVLY